MDFNPKERLNWHLTRLILQGYMKLSVTTDPADQDYSFTLTMPDPFDIKVQDYR